MRNFNPRTYMIIVGVFLLMMLIFASRTSVDDAFYVGLALLALMILLIEKVSMLIEKIDTLDKKMSAIGKLLKQLKERQ